MIRVLIVDDHAVLRDGLRGILAAAPDIEVVGEAGDGAAALKQLVALRPDVALLDLSLPLLSGLDVLREVQARKLPTAVLVLSMHDAPTSVRAAFELGARGYLPKESAGETVVAGVRAVHAGKRYVPPALADALLTGLLAPAAADPLAALSARERQVMRLVCEGRTSAEIGKLLHLSPKTVDTYRSRLMAKLGVGDLPALVRLAIRAGLLPAEG